MQTQLPTQKMQWLLLLILLFAFSLGEYLFLTVTANNGKLYISALKLFSKAGWFVRLLLAVLYPLGFALRPIKLSESGKVSDGSNRTSGKTKAIQVFLYLLGTVLLVSLHYNPFFKHTYPVAMVILAIGGYYTGKMLKRKPAEKDAIQTDRKKKATPYSFHFKGSDQSGGGGRWVNIVNPFRGTLVIGGAGSGKSHSIAEPILAQAAEKGYCGIVYDFKFPTLTDFVYSQYCQKVDGAPLSFYVINFEDLTRTHRVNPLKPEYIPAAAYASEYALSIVNNLMPETIAKPDFWARSAQALLTSTIWYLKKYHPAQCTLPHVIQMIVYKDYNVLLRLLAQDYECASMIRSILTASEMKAANQTAGMVSTLQLGLGRINTPEICYVLSGDEFSLDINDPKDPKILCLGSSPTLAETFAPLISCSITVALKLMNQQGKRHSLVLLDEAPTLYIPHLDQLPATARSNKVATVYMAQDFSQMRKQYGQNEAEALISNLNNQFFGRVANLNTAEYVSRLFGKEERVIRSESNSNNTPRGVLFNPKAGLGSQGSSVSHSLVERTVVYPQKLLNLQVGHFMGTTVETDSVNFSMAFQSPAYKRSKIEPFRSLEENQVADTYQRIIKEAESILATAPPPIPQEQDPDYRVG
ncbi:type IV secretion system DNA-binding domain-containing protein [Cytophagaceae bacterium YF14B1]|uniref:Type IV secretion system DNA-binding domain-containing protein n=1 Tax=Xanthocytophaga flava TaxID=3048013 RepID=A0AAE3UDL4_9BACT|nr:type IV secretory system conjugative DNA transfer family protein [Xanthocytophaga flavus]MDJ1485899.1 type IV secretion system DNA-binding domain-containing protein [Xanthocytophaga flavus]